MLSALAAALKLTQKIANRMQSFVNILIECNRAQPEQMFLYKHSILLHKLYNTELPETEWMAPNFQQFLTSRQTKFSVIKTNKKELATISWQTIYMF